MAYKCIKKEWITDFDGYIHKFICDSEADIADLPKCSPGSVAIVATEGRPKYGINASGEWTLIEGGSGGSGGGSGGAGGGGKELVVTVTEASFATDSWKTIVAETNMSWADAKAAVLDGSLTKVVVLEHLGDEYMARIHNADIRSASLDDGMNFSLCIDYMNVNHNGAATIMVDTRSIIWKESGDMSGKQKQIIA